VRLVSECHQRVWGRQVGCDALVQFPCVVGADVGVSRNALPPPAGLRDLTISWETEYQDA
jgi:hypothetical protein